jgi:tetratricopeptide (TPR) repeat protein
MSKLALLVLGYFWIGSAYKLFYAQTHDLSRFPSPNQIPISYYQREYLIDALMNQTWVLGPAFREYIGEPPPLGALVTSNPLAAMADYLKSREKILSSFPERYPRSLFAEEALEDGYLISQGAAALGVFSTREEPRKTLMSMGPRGDWVSMGVPDMSGPTQIARRLANDYPSSPEAPKALLRLAQGEQQAGREREANEAFRRLAAEYPDAQEAADAANVLYETARRESRLEEARAYRQRALEITERVARRRFPGKALPAQSAVYVMGFRVDLAGIEVGLRNLPTARTLLDQATREANRLEALPSKDAALRDPLQNASQRLDQAENELWVARAFQALKLEAPGPAPRAEGFPVSGAVRLAGRPLAGAEVLLTRMPMEAAAGAGGLGMLAQVRYRATTDALGQYQIQGVPGGGYYFSIVTPTRAAAHGNRPVVPAVQSGVPPRIRVRRGPLTLPTAALTTGIGTRTFGEQSAVDGKIVLAWDPYPGATSYRVEVLARQNVGAFERRVSQEERGAFLSHPVLWSTEVASGTQASCPLLSLAADNPIATRMFTFDYAVTALDKNGKRLASSADPLCRFVLSASAFRELLLAKPPDRGGRRGPRFLRPRNNQP